MVYGIIGILALKLALGSGGETTNQQGAMRRLAEQHFGKVLLLLLAVGLAGYAVWRLTRAALGRGPEGSDKGFDRIAALGSGLVYGGLFFAAMQILRGAGGGSRREREEDDGGRLRPAGREVARPARGDRADRRRPLSGLPRL